MGYQVTITPKCSIYSGSTMVYVGKFQIHVSPNSMDNQIRIIGTRRNIRPRELLDDIPHWPKTEHGISNQVHYLYLWAIFAKTRFQVPSSRFQVPSSVSSSKFRVLFQVPSSEFRSKFRVPFQVTSSEFCFKFRVLSSVSSSEFQVPLSKFRFKFQVPFQVPLQVNFWN